MFESVKTAPPDPILGLSEAFAKDPRTNKINLAVGVYKDAAGGTPILKVVKQAEKLLLEREVTKGYKPIEGDPVFGRLVREMLFGQGSELVPEGRAQTAHTPGGTGALRVVGDYVHSQTPSASVWCSDPTWVNHQKVFEAAGLATKSYPYFDAKNNKATIDAMLEALAKAPAGDVVLLHGGCHNPTGADPTREDWQKIANVLAQRGLLPLIDFAYQGFGTGLEEDAEGVRLLAAQLPELFICSSFSKNFGLYNERTGALTLLAKTPAHGEAVLSQIKSCIRANYSNPPAHGAAIVRAILEDAALRKQWLGELAEMRDRINSMRTEFVSMLKKKGAKQDFGFIAHQRGMFSFSGLDKNQVERLKSEFAIYIVGSGRINVAGMTPDNLGPLTDAIVAVL
ncbi:MAG TPA: amino acid aminotransferase [Polyangiaceae bacterium]|jgi:aspartate aminotransferase|nr:amino acid aminotransferase [Polyangiaceae bacterium]